MAKKDTKAATTTEATPLVDVRKYGKPGTSDIVTCAPQFVPEGYVEVVTDAPSNYHILDQSGDWQLDSNADIDKIREAEFLKAYPVAQQLEAMEDKMNGDSTKFDQMQATFAQIRTLYPKR